MKKFLLVLLIPGVATLACNKTKDYSCPDITTTAPADEITAVRNYVFSIGITTAKEDPRGFFYTMDNPGTGAKPDACSGVVVDYTGKLTNGHVFDTALNASLYLRGLLIAWREALPLMGVGDKMTLYVPPSLGYGPDDIDDVPGNSILIFDIKLHSFK